MSERLPAVLVVDDEIRSQEALRRTLEEDFRVHTASSAAQARGIMSAHRIEVLLTDQRMPGTSGVEFLKEVRRDWPDTVRIIISGFTDSEDIIAGVNEAGIYQYLLKPWHPEQLRLTLVRAAELYRLQQENCQLAVELRAAEPALRSRVRANRRRVREAFDRDNIVRAPESPMNAVCDMVARAARYDVSILLSGESGTGKELLARAIHYASGRAERPFVVENCGALADTLLESELFGHKKGAFTGATEERDGLFRQADGGTLFLDAIGEDDLLWLARFDSAPAAPPAEPIDLGALATTTVERFTSIAGQRGTTVKTSVSGRLISGCGTVAAAAARPV